MIPSSSLYLQEANRILQLHHEQSSCVLKSLSNTDYHFYILQFQQISSTMLFSQNWNKDLVLQNTVFVFTAKRQSKGKGQKSNTWASPEGNIYMTILASQPVTIIPCLYFSVCCMIAENIQKLTEEKLKVQIKWINDIFVNGLKTGGILIKTDIYGSNLFIQAGIGINVQTAPIQGSTCLSQHVNGIKLDASWRQTFVQKLSIAIIKCWKNIENLRLDLIEQYNERLVYKGEVVNIYDQEFKAIISRGIFIGLNEHGFALLDRNNGDIIQVGNGRMRKKAKYNIRVIKINHPHYYYMKTQNRMNLHFSGSKQKAYLFRVDKQFLKQLQTCDQMMIQGQASDQAIITSETSCFRVKGIHISTTMLVIDNKGTILQQQTGYLDVQKFIPYFNEIYTKIVAISHDGLSISNLSLQSLVQDHGFTKQAIKKQCFISDQQFNRISKAMGFVSFSQGMEESNNFYVYISSTFSLTIMRQIIKIHTESTKNLFQSLEISTILDSISSINMNILRRIAQDFNAKLEPIQHPKHFQLNIKSLIIFILREMGSAKKQYLTHTFDQIMDQMMAIYLPAEVDMTVSMMKDQNNAEMKELYDLRYLFFIDAKGERYVAYDYMEIQTDITARLKFLSGYKNRWKYAQLKSIFRGIDSTENGKFLTLGDVLLKKFRKYGDEYEIKFILPNK